MHRVCWLRFPPSLAAGQFRHAPFAFDASLSLRRVVDAFAREEASGLLAAELTPAGAEPASRAPSFIDTHCHAMLIHSPTTFLFQLAAREGGLQRRSSSGARHYTRCALSGLPFERAPFHTSSQEQHGLRRRRECRLTPLPSTTFSKKQNTATGARLSAA